MPNFWESEKFQAAKEEWDEILRKEGFEDIEIEVNGFTRIKVPTLTEGRFGGLLRHTSGSEGKEQYFYALTQALTANTEFDDDFDRVIMELTSEGATIREISREIKKMLPPGRIRGKFNRDTIRYVRRRYEHRWGIKSWKAEQMVSRKVRTKS